MPCTKRHCFMAYQSPPQPTTPISQQQQSKTQFEFTRRKKWTDVIISELPDTLILVLDSEARIQYVNASVRELLGWDVDELSESSVLTLINEDDRKRFHERFELTAHTLEPFASYTRFKCKPSSASSLTSSSPSTSAPVGIPETSQMVNSPQSVNQDQSHNSNQKELLFEVNGNLLFGPETSEKYAHLNGNNSSEVPKFFCFMAKPYPSRNMAILNTFLELKLENERLTQRRDLLKFEQQQRDIRVRGTIQSLNSPTSISNTTPTYTSPLSENSRPNVTNSDPSSSNKLSSTSNVQFSNHSFSRMPESAQALPSPANHKFEDSLSASGSGSGIGGKDDEDTDEGGKRKKPKKAHNAGPNQPQYVCTICGSTGSPEWRKGPKGPKTLCNACGLRWAKRAKKDGGDALGGIGGAGGANNPRGNSEGEGSPSLLTTTKSNSNPRAPMVHSALSVTPNVAKETTSSVFSLVSGVPPGQAHNTSFSPRVQIQGYQGQGIGQGQGQNQGLYSTHAQSTQQQQGGKTQTLENSQLHHPHLHIRTQHLGANQHLPSPSPTHITHAISSSAATVTCTNTTGTNSLEDTNYAMDHVHAYGHGHRHRLNADSSSNNSNINTGGHMHGQGQYLGPEVRTQDSYPQAQDHTMFPSQISLATSIQVPGGYSPIHSHPHPHIQPHSHSHPHSQMAYHPSLEQEQQRQPPPPQQQHQPEGRVDRDNNSMCHIYLITRMPGPGYMEAARINLKDMVILNIETQSNACL
ncbi:white collar 2 type of transcription factor [Pyrrhoderma noxium]|uniref:White collar 2 type of transcription factor n=1 Tax=Pyrrhoderma noxium TaxID=2282107 RepID=A0A286UW64_9AGAM|nr:white collar 2 type of transcription factor [Pyrrhoderma noxium]